MHRSFCRSVCVNGFLSKSCGNYSKKAPADEAGAFFDGSGVFSAWPAAGVHAIKKQNAVHNSKQLRY
jgi:hypothetical protein